MWEVYIRIIGFILLTVLIPFTIYSSVEWGGGVNDVYTLSFVNSNWGQDNLLNGKLNIKNKISNYVMFAEANMYITSSRSSSPEFLLNRLYVSADINLLEITIGRQFFITSSGRMFRINNFMPEIYSIFYTPESMGRDGISILLYPPVNWFGFRTGIFINPRKVNVKDNSAVFEEELNISNLNLKFIQMYNRYRIDFTDSDRYVFCMSANMDWVFGLNGEIQTYANRLNYDSLNYMCSAMVDYTMPIGNGIYTDIEFLYKSDVNYLLFHFPQIENGNYMLASEISYPFNLSYTGGVFSLYNISDRSILTSIILKMGKQIFHTTLMGGYYRLSSGDYSCTGSIMFQHSF